MGLSDKQFSRARSMPCETRSLPRFSTRDAGVGHFFLAQSVFLLSDLFHSLHDLPVEVLLRCDMRDPRGSRCSLPVLLRGRGPNHITRPSLSASALAGAYATQFAHPARRSRWPLAPGRAQPPEPADRSAPLP